MPKQPPGSPRSILSEVSADREQCENRRQHDVEILVEQQVNIGLDDEQFLVRYHDAFIVPGRNTTTALSGCPAHTESTIVASADESTTSRYTSGRCTWLSSLSVAVCTGEAPIRCL